MNNFILDILFVFELPVNILCFLIIYSFSNNIEPRLNNLEKKFKDVNNK